VTQEQIQQLENKIVKGYKPEEIYLFDSYTTPTKNSDIILLIVKDTDTK
jgi:hypothetical protein